MVMRAQYAGTCRTCGRPITVGSEIEWSRATGARHVKCPEVAPIAVGAIKWSRGEGYGGETIPTGTVVRHRDHGVVVILSCTSRYYRDDGMSVGVGDESGYVYTYTARPATDEEVVPLLAQEQAAARKQAARTRLAQLETSARTWEYPQELAGFPEGETVIKAKTSLALYGGGTSWVIDEDYIWCLVGNGADGDNWSLNNLPSAIARRTPYDEALAQELRQIAADTN